MTDLTDELRRLEVLSDEADLSAVSGVDIVLENESVRVDETNVDDIVNLDISASGSGTRRRRAAADRRPRRSTTSTTDLSELDTDASDERRRRARRSGSRRSRRTGAGT